MAECKGINHSKCLTFKTVDTVRKFFKDTAPDAIRDWYNIDMQHWFRAKKAYDHRGIFVLDQTHIVVPDNPNYHDAVKLPVDENGQWYRNLSALTAEQRLGVKHHPCYTISTLLNATPEQGSFHMAGYELGRGNEDELPQAERLISTFNRHQPGAIKELIVDRGYISGELISQLKLQYRIDVLIPLKKNRDDYTDALAIAKLKNEWHLIEEKKDDFEKTITTTEAVIIHDMALWDSCTVPLSVMISKETAWDEENKKYHTHYYVLASTRHFKHPKDMIERYKIRTQIEERYRQLKLNWYITEFPSPHASLIESHVCFTLFTYSLMQLYLSNTGLQEKNRLFLSTLKDEEHLGKDAVLVYAKNQFGVFDHDEYSLKIMTLEGEAKQRLYSTLKAQREAKLKRSKVT